MDGEIHGYMMQPREKVSKCRLKQGTMNRCFSRHAGGILTGQRVRHSLYGGGQLPTAERRNSRFDPVAEQGLAKLQCWGGFLFHDNFTPYSLRSTDFVYQICVFFPLHT